MSNDNEQDAENERGSLLLGRVGSGERERERVAAAAAAAPSWVRVINRRPQDERERERAADGCL